MKKGPGYFFDLLFIDLNLIVFNDLKKACPLFQVPEQDPLPSFLPLFLVKFPECSNNFFIVG